MWDLPLFCAGIDIIDNVSKKYGTWAAVLAGLVMVALFIAFIYVVQKPEMERKEKQSERDYADANEKTKT